MKTILLFIFLILFFFKIDGQVKIKNYFKLIEENVNSLNWFSENLKISNNSAFVLKGKVVADFVVLKLNDNDKHSNFTGFIIKTDSLFIYVQSPLTTDISSCNSLCIYYFDKNWTPLSCKIISDSLLVGEWHYKLLNNQLNCSLAVLKDKTVKFKNVVLEEVNSIDSKFNYVTEYDINQNIFINRLFEYYW
jgi:hypothetical protein